MEKKEYVSPHVDIVEIEMQSSLLADSGLSSHDAKGEYGGAAGVSPKRLLWDTDE